jgi:hypothetical protein
MSKRVFKAPSLATDFAKNSNPILGELFSPEFMTNLKDELNNKVRSSKTIDKTDDDLFTITKKYDVLRILRRNRSTNCTPKSENSVFKISI